MRQLDSIQSILTGLKIVLALGLMVALYSYLALNPEKNVDLAGVFFDGILFVMVFICAVLVLPQWRELGILSLGILFLLFGVFSNLLDGFYMMPGWIPGFVESGLLLCGAGISAIGLWMWIRESRRIEEALFRTSEEQRVLREVLMQVSLMDMDGLLKKITEEALKLLRADRVQLRLLDSDGVLRKTAIAGKKTEIFQDRLPGMGSGHAAWVLENQRPLSIKDISQDRKFGPDHVLREIGMKGYLSVPLISRGRRSIGILSALSLTVREFTPEEIALAQQLAAGASIAIENSKLFQESQSREEIQTLLKEISQDVTSLDIDSLLKKLTDKVRQVFRVDICDVRVKGNIAWQVLGVSGIDAEQVRTGSTESSQGRSSWVIRNRKPLSVTDITKETEIPIGESARRIGIRGYLGVPLFSKGGEVVAVLRTMTYQPREFTREEVQLLQQLANEAAVALLNARLLDDLKVTNQELEQSSLEQRAVREFLSNLVVLDLDELLQRFAEQAAYLFQAEIAWVRLLDSKGKMLGRAAAGDETVLSILPIKGTGQVVGRGKWMLDNRKPLAVRDMAHDSDRPYHGAVKAADLHGFLGAPLFSKDGKPLGVIFVMTRSSREFSRREIDLIEQFANGAAIAIDNARLFEEVQIKSGEAADAYEAKSEFLNTLAHELRTPLNVIIGSLQLLLDGFYGTVTERQKPGLEMLERNAYDLRNLINEVLDLARIEAGKVPVLIEEFAPKEVVAELESSYVDLYGEKGLELKIKMENSVPRLTSDKSKLKEILQNLLANAAKYTEKGEVELKVHCLQDKQGDPERTRVAFSVRDTGIGIKSEELAHLFEPFYMAEGLDRKRYPGTGLGLSIVKRLVDILDGEIKVESEWGIGSTFTVIFPLVPLSQQ